MTAEVVELGTGRRARKRREIHARIAHAALDLFMRNGFDAATVDAIAEAADVSRRSFFHYFASKEDVVFFWKDEFNEAVAAESPPPLKQRPIDLVEQVLMKVARRYQSDQIIAIDRLIRATPSLMARKQVHYDTQERGLAAALARRWPGHEPMALRLVAIAGIGVLRSAVDAWSAHGYTRSFNKYLNDGFQLLRRELSGAGDRSVDATTSIDPSTFEPGVPNEPQPSRRVDRTVATRTYKRKGK